MDRKRYARIIILYYQHFLGRGRSQHISQQIFFVNDKDLDLETLNAVGSAYKSTAMLCNSQIWIYQMAESTEVVLLRLAAAGGDGESAAAARGGSIPQDQGLGIVIQLLFCLHLKKISQKMLRNPLQLQLQLNSLIIRIVPPLAAAAAAAALLSWIFLWEVR